MSERFLVLNRRLRPAGFRKGMLGDLFRVLCVMAGLIPEPISFAAEQVRVVTERIELFNGRNLDGLYTWLADSKREDPRRVFTVTNQMLRISGDGLGYVSTRDSFRDYQLVLEFKWGHTNTAWGDRLNKARDSGLFLHSSGPEGNSYDGQGAFKAAIECNIFQGATGDILLIRGKDAQGEMIAPRITAAVAVEVDQDGWPFWKPDGSRRTLERWGRLNWFAKDRNWRDQWDFRGSQDVERPAGEWNQIECLCDGARITIKVNGVVVNEVFDAYPNSGPILLQCEGSEIFFRRFELRPLRR